MAPRSSNFLAVVGAGSQSVHRLPKAGTVKIGRGDDCEIVIEDASVSRHHAEIDVGPPLTIRDLGSSNGTRLQRRGETAETVELFELRLVSGQSEILQTGEAVSLGSVMVFVRSDDPSASNEASPPTGADQLVVVSKEMSKLRELAVRIAKGPTAVLLSGETGAGKEVVARLLHASSPRAGGPFVAINCAAIPEALAESELFGHEAGAFTGASSAKKGYFEAAHGGTVFLDEVTELSPAVQAKLLRVLEDKKIHRVGGSGARSVDVRVVSATNGDVAARVKAGLFRQDLWFRLNGMSLAVPPLRSRTADIPELAHLFAAQTAWGLGEKPQRLSRDVLARLEGYDWPGNVRELRNVVERAVVLAGGRPIEVTHLLLDAAPAPPTAPSDSGGSELKVRMDGLEKKAILEALERFQGNQTKAADALGMPRRTFVTRLGEYGVPRPRKR